MAEPNTGAGGAEGIDEDVDFEELYGAAEDSADTGAGTGAGGASAAADEHSGDGFSEHYERLRINTRDGISARAAAVPVTETLQRERAKAAARELPPLARRGAAVGLEQAQARPAEPATETGGAPGESARPGDDAAADDLLQGLLGPSGAAARPEQDEDDGQATAAVPAPAPERATEPAEHRSGAGTGGEGTGPTMTTKRIAAALEALSGLSELEREVFLDEAGLLPADNASAGTRRARELALATAEQYEREADELRVELAENRAKITAAAREWVAQRRELLERIGSLEQAVVASQEEVDALRRRLSEAGGDDGEGGALREVVRGSVGPGAGAAAESREARPPEETEQDTGADDAPEDDAVAEETAAEGPEDADPTAADDPGRAVPAEADEDVVDGPDDEPEMPEDEGFDEEMPIDEDPDLDEIYG